MNICTIVASNYLAHARVLANSFLRHHPGSECHVLLVDDCDEIVRGADEPFTLIRPSDLALSRSWFDEMRAGYNVLELSTALKPWLLQYMLREERGDSLVVYLDPDVRIESRMEELERRLRKYPIVLTPHLTAPLPSDGLRPGETDILIAGTYNLGFIGVTRSAEADALLAWWSARLRKDCRVLPARGLFVDQRWMDFAPGLHERLHLLRLTNYNVAYWNVPTRALSNGGDTITVDGHPLRFFHFSGYTPRSPRRLSLHQNRIALTTHPVLRKLCDGYRADLFAAGYDEVCELPYGNGTISGGLELTETVRDLYREAVESGDVTDSVFTDSGAAAFIDWLNEPVAIDTSLSRYLHRLWTDRADLRFHFPKVRDADLAPYLDWCSKDGRQQNAIPEPLLPPAGAEGSAGTSGRQLAARPLLSSANADPTTVRPFGVNVAGYLCGRLGVGEVARQVIGALDAAAVPALAIGLAPPLGQDGHEYAATSKPGPFAVNVVCVNADGFPAFAHEVGSGFFDGRYTIGFWWWETDNFPGRYADSFELVDEVWVGSHFVAEALAKVAPVPVVYMPVAISLPEAVPLRIGELGWPDAFTVLFSWDYNSVFARKNPLGAIEAYCTAFGPRDGAALVLKCINHQQHAAHHDEVRAAAAARPDILLIDRPVSPRDKNRLVASCDCFLSLHRSEGLGLTMLEAMHFGTPVVATGYSGNADFLTRATGFPVDYELVAIGSDADPYPPDGRWAEPDLNHAAHQLRRVFEHPREAERVAARARSLVQRRYSPFAVGQTMSRRLRKIEQLRLTAAAGPVAPRESGHEELNALLQGRGRPRFRSRFGRGGGIARWLALRLMRPYTTYQADVNDSLSTVLDDVGQRLSELERRTTAGVAEMRQADSRVIDIHASLTRELRRQAAVDTHILEAVAIEEVERDRGLRTQAQDVQDGFLAEGAEREKRLALPERLIAETRAAPYMSQDAFGVFERRNVGRVYGYRRARSNGGAPDHSFAALFRGDESFITERQRRYLPLLEGHDPVLDLGCGRGELLDLLREAGISALGVDRDAAMVARCREKGHSDTATADAVQYLEGCPDESFGVIFSAQLLEHLPPGRLVHVIDLALRKLAPGGRFVAETVNPHSVSAMKVFWVDISHQHPLFPETMLALCRTAGFTEAYVFHPNGCGNVEEDRYTTGEYAIVASSSRE